jgi:hypothetical protein
VSSIVAVDAATAAAALSRRLSYNDDGELFPSTIYRIIPLHLILGSGSSSSDSSIVAISASAAAAAMHSTPSTIEGEL